MQRGSGFFSHRAGLILDMRSPIRLQKMHISDYILNQVDGSENLFHSLFSVVPMDLVAIASFCNGAM